MQPDRTCSDVKSQLPLFVGGDLEDPFVEGVREHLAACPACTGELEHLRDSRNLLLGLRAIAEVPEEEVDLWPRLRDELEAAGAFAPGSMAPPAADERPSVRSGPQQRPGRPVRHWRRWTAVAAAAGLLGTLALMGQFGARGPQTPGAPTGPSTGTGGAELAIQPEVQPAGMRLHRAEPGEERMADSSRPFLNDPNGLPLLPNGRQAGHVLAGDDGLR